MASKEGQFDEVELMVQGFEYQFECSTYEWNDSFRSGTIIRFSEVKYFLKF